MPEIVEPTNGVPTEEINNLKITPSITMTAPSDCPSEPEDALFTDNLISPTIAATLPPTYILRPLRKSDYAIGFLDVLRVLTTVGDITEEEWNGRYDWMNNQGKGGYYIMVIEDQGRIVGTGALLVERKLYVPRWPLAAPLFASTSANSFPIKHPPPRPRRSH
jgi:glucosamine-phosphate N-acetyltransferase